MTKTRILFLACCYGPAALVLAQSDQRTSLPTAFVGSVTNQVDARQLREQSEAAKLQARQSILNPVAPPNYSHLEAKDPRNMSVEELRVLAILRPQLIQEPLEKAKTPEQRRLESQARQSISDPIAFNQALEKTKTAEQKKKEADAARAILNPREPSLKEFHSQTIARPQ